MPHTLVLFESPMRVGKTLAAALEVLGNREAAVCCELTKLHERVRRGPLADLASEYAGRRIKGEVTLVIAGSNPKFRHEPRPAPTGEAAAPADVEAGTGPGENDPLPADGGGEQGEAEHGAR
jgi:16S rRNA C1402 (ribose-2'-O) methylase RsmI